jgi:hypothetical protein
MNFGVCFDGIEKFELQWICKKFWIQNPDNQWKVLIYVSATILAIIGLIYTMSK